MIGPELQKPDRTMMIIMGLMICQMGPGLVRMKLSDSIGYVTNHLTRDTSRACQNSCEKYPRQVGFYPRKWLNIDLYGEYGTGRNKKVLESIIWIKFSTIESGSRSIVF